MDRGFNKHLAIDLFLRGQITNKIVDGQKQSDRTQAESNMRLGYMGHLTLIAEEVVKFTERQQPELLSSSVYDKVVDPDWVYYVERTLAETRERDNAILGGVRPDMMAPNRPGMVGSINLSTFGGGVHNQVNFNTADTGLDTIELQNSGVGEGPETHLPETFDGDDGDVGADIGSREGLPQHEESQKQPSGFGSSSDEDEDEEMNDDDDDDDVTRIGITGNSDQVRYLQVLLSEDVEDDIEDEEDEHDVGIGEGFEHDQSKAETSTTVAEQNGKESSDDDQKETKDEPANDKDDAKPEPLECEKTEKNL